MRVLSVLLPLGLLLFTSIVSAVDEVTTLRQHSLYVPFVDEELRIRWWDYGGDTIIDTNNHIRLTTDNPSRQGWIWSKLPLPEDAWQVEFEFNVHGEHHLYGDGFAMWATSERTKPGPVFGNQDYFEGLGIFFDTYMNSNTDHNFPYVFAMLGDGRTQYDIANDGKANDIGGCESEFRGLEQARRARVTYYKGAHLKLELLVKNALEYDVCFTLDRNVTLPKVSYLGFSAHTGEVTDNHDIIWVSTSEIPNKPPITVSHEQFNFHHSSGTALGFFFKLVLFSVICGVLFIGYRMYQSQGNKRF